MWKVRKDTEGGNTRGPSSGRTEDPGTCRTDQREDLRVPGKTGTRSSDSPEGETVRVVRLQNEVLPLEDGRVRCAAR